MKMRLYVVEPGENIVMVREADYLFQRYLHWAENLDRYCFIVIDGTLKTDHLDRRLGA